MKQTEIGMIPDDWEVKKIEALCSLITGYPFPGEAIKEHGVYPLLRGINITEGNIRHSQDIDKFFSGTLTKLENYRLCENDLVIGMDGSKVGKNSALINRRDVGALLVQRVARLREIKDISDVSYIYSFINSFYFANYVDSLKTSSAIPHISPKNIKEFKIPLPPTLAEQQKIAKALSDVDNVISTLEKLITKKKNLKQGTMQQLLTGKKRLPGFAKSNKFKQTEIGEITEDWEVKSFGNFVTIVRGGSPRPIQDYLTNNSDGINWIKIGDVNPEDKYIVKTEEKILPSGKARSREVHKGDFILSNSMSFGRPYILKINGCIHDGWLAIQNYTTTFDSDYLYYLLGSEKVFEQYILMAAGSSVQNLNKQKVSKLIVQIPSKPEQSAIANVLSSMDKEIEALNTKLEKYRNLKTGMMQQLLTGKIRLV